MNKLLSLAVPGLVVLLSSCASLPRPADPGDEVVVTYLGFQHYLNAVEGATPVAAQGNVIEVQPVAPGGFRVATLRAGTGAVNWIYADGRPGRRMLFQVLPRELRAKLEAVRHLTAGIDGVQLRATGEKLVLDGNLRHRETVVRDMDRLLQVQAAYPADVVNLVGIGPEVYEQAREAMNRDIQRDPGSQAIRVEFSEGAYLILGRAAGTAERERAENIVMHFLPPILGSPAIRENVLVLGAKKFSIRNFVSVGEPGWEKTGRAPASK